MKKITNVVWLFSFLFLMGCGGEAPKSTSNKSAPKITPKVEKTAPVQEEKVAKSTVPPEQLSKAKELIASVSDKEIEGVDAKGKYKLFCSICHGREGKLVMNGSKKLSISKISLEERVAQIYFGKGTMTPHKGLLKDVEIVAVAKYIESFR